MNFYTVIVMLTYFVAIEAKLKSESSDVSTGDSKQQLSLDIDSSDEESEDEPLKTRGHVHKHLSKTGFETRRWHRTCIRKASKMCTKACSKAYKTVCKKRKCNKKSKKFLKKECRKSCTRHFEFDKDRAAYEE